jgi:tagatose-1,6-bisphosphate aldolase
VAIVAMDQRNTLRRMLSAEHRPTDPDTIRSFKLDVVEALSRAASAVLLDPGFGVPAVREAEVMAPGCAILVAVEPGERDAWEGRARPLIASTERSSRSRAVVLRNSRRAAPSSATAWYGAGSGR